MFSSRYFFFLIFFSTVKLFSQTGIGFPFLLSPFSPKISAAGAAGTASLTNDPFKFYFNPAHLGYSSSEMNFSGGFYLDDYHVNGESGPSKISSYTFTAGYNLNKILNGLPISAGIGYSRSEKNILDYSEDIYSSYSIGIGYHSIINISAGITVKDITSIITYFMRFGDSELKAQVTALDYGILANIPLNNLLKEPLKFNVFNDVSIDTKLNYTLGYTVQNVGDGIYYVDPGQADPIGRTARLAHNIQMAAGIEINNINIDMLTFSYSVEAEDLLVKIIQDSLNPFPQIKEYQGIFGDIKFINNLFLGKGDKNVVVHKGYILELLETFIIAGGGFDGREFQNSKTSGVGIKSRGFFKLISMMGRNDVFEFLEKHIEFEYFKTNYLKNSGDDRKFSGITFTLRNF